MTAELRIIGQESKIMIPDTGLVLGREPDPSKGKVHKIANKGASREHCRIWQDAGRWMIEDLDSANGTQLNSKMLEPRRAHALQQGDKIQLGNDHVTVLVATFHAQESPPPIPNPELKQLHAELARGQGDVAALQQQLTAEKRRVEDLEAKLRASQTVRLQAEEREALARHREQEARTAAAADTTALEVLRRQHTELTANYLSQKQDLASYRERVAQMDGRETQSVRDLQKALTLASDRNQRLERELGQAIARIGELDVVHKTAVANRDAALTECEAVRERITELEEVIQKQSDLLREVQGYARTRTDD